MPYFTTSDGISLHYTDEGTGLPILCLAGLTRTVSDFDYVAPYLTNHRLIRLDYRGRGQSQRDPNWRNYALPVEARDVIALMDHLKLDKVAILGTSRGGLIAMLVGALAPERLLGVALNDIGPEIETDSMVHITPHLGRKSSHKSFEEAAAALERNMIGFSNVPKSRWLEEAHKHFVPDGAGFRTTYDPNIRQAVEAEDTMPDFWPGFDAFAKVPICCLHAQGSTFLSAQTVAKMQARRPDMICASVPDRGHIPFMDEPESLNALKTWLEQLT